MRTTMMNGKLNLLDDMAQVLAAPRTKRPVGQPTPEVRVRGSRATTNRYRRSVARPLWRISLEAARETAAEQVLRGALLATAGAALLWSGFALMQFVFAWSNLVTWVRSAMV